jgi:hypothetical protein
MTDTKHHMLSAEYALPRAASAATRLRAGYPELGRLLLLTNKDPRAAPARYVRSRTPASEIKSWAHYSGDTTQPKWLPPLPGLYRQVATTIVNESLIDLSTDTLFRAARLAVVWNLAGTAMASVLSKDEADRVLKDDHSFAMLVGPGPVDFTAGLYVPKTNKLAVPDGAVTAGSVVALTDYEKTTPIY